MSDKRRRNRVQGGWGSASSNRKKDDKKESSKKEEHKTIIPNDQFLFNATVEIKNKPNDKCYDKNGSYVLSTTCNGDSNIDIFYDFIEPSECEWIFEHLLNNIPWKQENIVIKGEEKTQPRLTAWYGDMSYTYSKLTLHPHHFCNVLNILKEKIEQKTKMIFNSMLANFYRNEKDSIDWHSDDEESLGDNPIIASLSFGDHRNFELRQKPDTGNDFSYSQHVKVPLSSGSLIVMYGATQKDWQHRVPKEYHDHDERINLTFRQMVTTHNL